MKKFYLSIIKTIVLFGITGTAHAQFTGGTFTTVPAGGDLAVPATWVGGMAGQPPDNCNNCQIVLFGNCVINNPGIILTNGCQIIVSANGTLTLNQRVEIMSGSEFIIGTDATSPAELIMNAEGDLDTTSIVRLANTNTEIDATEFNPSPSDSIDLISGNGVGLYYITGPTTYSELLDGEEYGNPFAVPDGAHPTFVYSMYTINCGPTPPNECNQGVVFGPALSGFNATDSIYEFNVAAILPVQLLKFAAVLNSNLTVGLSWTTAQEENSSYFSVQRSFDGSNFQEIGEVKAKGFSSIPSNYAFTDPSILNGKAYYRLKIVDLDGKFTYSKVLPVSTEVTGNSILVFSNPFTDQVRLQINITSADQINLSLTDVLGRSILKEEYSAQAGSNFVNLVPGAVAAPGMYLLSIKSNTFNQTIKLIKK
jgi:hypothetical protein